MDWASPLIESVLTDALATSARAMPRLRSGPHQHLHRKDVPHLSESLLIGIERWRFVESVVNEFLSSVTGACALIGIGFQPWMATSAIISGLLQRTASRAGERSERPARQLYSARA